MLNDTKILCVYCNEPWDDEMLNKLGFSECSYTPDCVGSKFTKAIDIICPHCKKLVYRKELDEMAEEHTRKEWEGFYD